MTVEEMGIRSWMRANSSQKTDLSSVLHSSKADYGATCSKQFLRGMLISSDKRLGGEKHRESVEARKITLKEADVRER